MAEEPSAYLAETVALAERVLSLSLGSAVRLGSAPQLDSSDRSHVFRLRLLEGPPDTPATVIVKRAAVGDDERYDPSAAAFPTPA